MNARHDNPDGPEDIDAAFAEIVAGLEQDETLARWPEEDEQDGQAQKQDSEQTARPQGTEPAGPRDWSAGEDAEEDEGHFEPPEPPPLPMPRPATLGGIGLMGIGVILLVVPGVIGLTSAIALPLGLVMISSGICWLLLRLRQGPADPGDDDGARL